MRKTLLSLCAAFTIAAAAPTVAQAWCHCEPSAFAMTYEHGGALAMWMGQPADAYMYPGWFTMGGAWNAPDQCLEDCAAWSRTYWADQICQQIGYDGEWIVQVHTWLTGNNNSNRYRDLQGDCHSI